MNVEIKKIDFFNIGWVVVMMLIALSLDMLLHQRITFWSIIWFTAGTSVPFIPELLKKRNPFKKYAMWK